MKGEADGKGKKPVFSYFNAEEADIFSFYRIPKALFTKPAFRKVSAEAKILYGMMLDRMSLSRKNGWVDEEGHVYIVFTAENAMEMLGCCRQKAFSLLSELEAGIGLIKRRRRGLGLVNITYVMDFRMADPQENAAVCKEEPLDRAVCGDEQEASSAASACPEDDGEDIQKYENHTSGSMACTDDQKYENHTSGSIMVSDDLKYENHTSRSMDIILQEVWNSYANDTDTENKTEYINNTESVNNTESSYTEKDLTSGINDPSFPSSVLPFPDKGRGCERKDTESPVHNLAVSIGTGEMADHGQSKKNPILPKTLLDNRNDGAFEAIKETVRARILTEDIALRHGKEKTDQVVWAVSGLLASQKPRFRLGSCNLPMESLKEKFCRLEPRHVDYLLDNMGAVGRIRNPEKYILTSLYNILAADAFIPERTGKYHPTKRTHPCGAFGAYEQRDNRDTYRKAERMMRYGISEDSGGSTGHDTYMDFERLEYGGAGCGQET